jgi:hypothetical protein
VYVTRITIIDTLILTNYTNNAYLFDTARTLQTPMSPLLLR